MRTRNKPEKDSVDMDDAGRSPQELGEQFLRSLDKIHLGAAASKLFAASIGEIVTILSRSPAHKHYSLADIEWMVLPAVITGQFHVVDAAHEQQGFRAPVAFVAWAFVSEEVDGRLAAQVGAPRVLLRPDEWKTGEVAWLIFAVGSADGVNEALRWLKEGPFRERPIKLIVGIETGKVQSLQDLALVVKGAAE
jgi:hemolysin-activating ACP:hemolysin acyltransferase